MPVAGGGVGYGAERPLAAAIVEVRLQLNVSVSYPVTPVERTDNHHIEPAQGAIEGSAAETTRAQRRSVSAPMDTHIARCPRDTRQTLYIR